MLLGIAGVASGLIGALVGLGGGFFAVPFLLTFPVVGGSPLAPPEATATSLGVVLLTALSSTTANARLRRIDYRTGLLLAGGTVPGIWIGRGLVGRLKAAEFSLAFAVLLLGVAAYLVFVRLKEGRGLLGGGQRELVDADGRCYRYGVHPVTGLAGGLGIGALASLFGIGGGLLLVPFFVIGYGMPLLPAAATAHFTFLFTASAGLLESVRRGHLSGAGLGTLLAMGLGAMAGSPLGVAAAKRVRPNLVRGVLAAVLVAVAIVMILESGSTGRRPA